MHISFEVIWSTNVQERPMTLESLPLVVRVSLGVPWNVLRVCFC